MINLFFLFLLLIVPAHLSSADKSLTQKKSSWTDLPTDVKNIIFTYPDTMIIKDVTPKSDLKSVTTPLSNAEGFNSGKEYVALMKRVSLTCKAEARSALYQDIIFGNEWVTLACLFGCSSKKIRNAHLINHYGYKKSRLPLVRTHATLYKVKGMCQLLSGPSRQRALDIFLKSVQPLVFKESEPPVFILSKFDVEHYAQIFNRLIVQQDFKSIAVITSHKWPLPTEIIRKIEKEQDHHKNCIFCRWPEGITTALDNVYRFNPKKWNGNSNTLLSPEDRNKHCCSIQ